MLKHTLEKLAQKKGVVQTKSYWFFRVFAQKTRFVTSLLEKLSLSHAHVFKTRFFCAV